MHCNFKITQNIFSHDIAIQIQHLRHIKYHHYVLYAIFVKAFKTYQKTLYLKPKALMNTWKYINGNHNTNCNS